MKANYCQKRSLKSLKRVVDPFQKLVFDLKLMGVSDFVLENTILHKNYAYAKSWQKTFEQQLKQYNRELIKYKRPNK